MIIYSASEFLKQNQKDAQTVEKMIYNAEKEAIFPLRKTHNI